MNRKAMNLFEFFYLAIYLSFLTALIAAIQIYNPGKMTREFVTESVKEIDGVETQEEETTESFNPEKEDYTMTENPMLRQRVNILDHIN